jgi:hypothetical protein
LLCFPSLRLHCAGLLCLLVLLLAASSVWAQTAQPPQAPAGTDFIEYWAAGRLLLNGGNPYSPGELGDVQATVATRAAAPLIMWNPPWALSFILPFGAMSFAVSQFSWLVLNLFLILWSAQHLWRIYAETAARTFTPWLVALTFLPAIFALMLGQITPLILFGLTAFLYWQRKQKGLAAGGCAVLIWIKPQLCYLFWPTLLLWVWREQQWRVFLGILLAGATAAAIPVAFNPEIYSAYFRLYTDQGVTTPFDWAAPTLGNALRAWLAPHRSALQFAPLAVGLAWLACYWRRHRVAWNWTERLPMLLLVSVSTSAYAWTFDQIVLLPALMQSAVWIERAPLTRYVWIMVILYAAANAVYLSGKVFVSNDFWYFWMAPLFLLFYVMLQKRVVAADPG